MRLYEHEAKALARDAGIPVPRGRLVATAAEAEDAAASLGSPVVVKAQVPVGGRGKAGGIRFADEPAIAREAAAELLAGQLRGFTVSSVLVEERLDISEEYYVGITIDEIAKRPVVMVGRGGGMGVEEAAAKGVEFARCHIDPFIGLQPFMARDLALTLTRTKAVSSATDVVVRLYRLYQAYDATLAEINPLVLTADGRVVAADCRMEIDDDALFRQRGRLTAMGIPIRQEAARPPTDLERRAAEIDNIDHRGVAGRVVEFDGDIALIIGGGGASLTTFDAILRYGGHPANYCEIGGNPTVRKVRELTRLLMLKPGVRSLAVITNVLSNTRVDLVARGVIKGLLDVGIDPSTFPIVVRSSGSWEDEGYRILDKYGIKWFDRTHSMDEAAEYIVKLARRREATLGDTD